MTIDEKNIPFEIFSDTGIVPKETWNEGAYRDGIALLSGKELRKQYAEVAKREERALRETVIFLRKLLSTVQHNPTEGSKKIARALIERFPKSDDARTDAIVHALGVLAKHPEDSPQGKKAIYAVAQKVLGIKTEKNRQPTLENLKTT